MMNSIRIIRMIQKGTRMRFFHMTGLLVAILIDGMVGRSVNNVKATNQGRYSSSIAMESYACM
jgi:hypothetical protein